MRSLLNSSRFCVGFLYPGCVGSPTLTQWRKNSTTTRGKEVTPEQILELRRNITELVDRLASLDETVSLVVVNKLILVGIESEISFYWPGHHEYAVLDLLRKLFEDAILARHGDFSGRSLGEPLGISEKLSLMVEPWDIRSTFHQKLLPFLSWNKMKDVFPETKTSKPQPETEL